MLRVHACDLSRSAPTKSREAREAGLVALLLRYREQGGELVLEDGAHAEAEVDRLDRRIRELRDHTVDDAVTHQVHGPDPLRLGHLVVGGYAGSRIGRALPESVLRALVVVAGVAAAVLLW